MVQVWKDLTTSLQLKSGFVFYSATVAYPTTHFSKSYPSISAEAHACILSSPTMLRSQGFKKWTSLPTSKHSPTSLFHSSNDATAPFLPLSGCLRSTDRMDSGSVFIGSVFSTACSRAPLRGWGMGEKHNAEGGEWRRWGPGSRSQTNEREGDVISLFSFFVFTFELETGEPSHMQGGELKRNTRKKYTQREKRSGEVG